MSASSKMVVSLALVFGFAGGAVPSRAVQEAAPQSSATQSAPSQAAPSQWDMPAWQKAAGGKLEFNVASVKQDTSPSAQARVMPTSNVPLAPGDAYPENGGLFRATRWPLIVYISFAYKLMPDQLQALSTELPRWAVSDTFDIEARADANPTKDQMRLMMQSLLEDRFKLVLHSESHERPVFALILEKPGKTGPQLQPHTNGSPECPPATAASALPISTATVAGGFPSECGSIVLVPFAKAGRIGIGARNVSMHLIASTISGAGKMIGDLGRPVVDKTGLSGTFDFLIQFAPQLPAGVKFPTEDDSAPTFLEALKDQLGLKLDAQTAQIQEIVIDHVDHPTEN
jgi:uncharacterized protein (TIGR03435 family)